MARGVYPRTARKGTASGARKITTNSRAAKPATKLSSRKAATAKTSGAKARTPARAAKPRTRRGRPPKAQKERVPSALVAPIRIAEGEVQSLALISERAAQPMTVVRQVLDATREIAGRHLVRGGTGRYTLPRLGVQLYRMRVAARPGRTGRNPRTGEPMQLRPLPAHDSVRARTLTAIKRAAQVT